MGSCETSGRGARERVSARTSAVLNFERVTLKFQHHTLETARDRGKWAFEDDLKGLVVSMYCDITLAKQ